jgi:hypothetical protein
MGLPLTFGPARGRSRFHPLDLVRLFYDGSQQSNVTGVVGIDGVTPAPGLVT